MSIHVDVEAAIIIEKILGASSLNNRCSLCGLKFGARDKTVICTSETCIPPRVFHVSCLNIMPDARTFQCAICDPSTRSDFCQRIFCKRPFDNDSIVCSDGCQRYMHKQCLPGGLTQYTCGVCKVALH